MEEVRWRVPVRVPAAKAILVAVLLYLAVVTRHGGWAVAVALVAAGGVAVWALRDLLVPVRVAGDTQGVTVVAGFGRRVWLPWSRVDRVRVDPRRRGRQLEIDAGEAVYVVGRYDVDTDLDEVAARLEALRAAARR